MIAIITLEEAKAHLRVTGTRFDSDYLLKTYAANAAINAYLQITDEDSPSLIPWGSTDDNDVPLDVKAAALIVLGTLDKARDGVLTPGSDRSSLSPISQAVQDLLRPYRDPPLA